MKKSDQIDLFLPDGGPRLPTLGDGEPVPPGPYRLSMLWSHGPGEGTGRYMRPYKIVAGNEQTIAGHIDNLATALRIRDLLNEHGPGAAITGHEGTDTPK